MKQTGRREAEPEEEEERRRTRKKKGRSRRKAKADEIAKLMNENEQLKAVIEDFKRKSNEAEVESLREEYHQRVATLERKERDTLRREQSKKSDAAALLKEKDEIINQVMAEDMKFIAAYLLAVLGGNASPSTDDLKYILDSVGVEVEDEKIELLLSEVKGKDFAELIASGGEKLASVPSGGGAVVVAAAPAGRAAAATAPSAEAKEEKKEEKEQSDDDMGFSLFD